MPMMYPDDSASAPAPHHAMRKSMLLVPFGLLVVCEDKAQAADEHACE
jgi:hypothetical protein